MSGLQRLLVALAMAILISSPASAAELYTFKEALRHGVVDIVSIPTSSEEEQQTLASVGQLGPGIINNMGYFWDGVSQKRLDDFGRHVATIRSQLARTLIAGSWNEAVELDYRPHLRCGGDLGSPDFNTADLTSGQKIDAKHFWLDLAKPAASSFYKCIGTMFVDRGATILNMAQASGLIAHASSKSRAIEMIQDVHAYLLSYARQRGIELAFQGDAQLSHIIPLATVYVASRFYHVTVPAFLKYQNKVGRPGIGVGYSYALSPGIISDTRALSAPGATVLFAIDNWDPSQDDLRRLMELDAENRRYLLLQSAKNARAGGAYMVLALNQCAGCVKPEFVADRNEILRDGHTEYNAVRCGDLATIKAALALP